MYLQYREFEIYRSTILMPLKIQFALLSFCCCCSVPLPRGIRILPEAEQMRSDMRGPVRRVARRMPIRRPVPLWHRRRVLADPGCMSMHRRHPASRQRTGLTVRGLLSHFIIDIDDAYTDIHHCHTNTDRRSPDTFNPETE